MILAMDAAKYLLTLDDQDAGDLMSNLKLQKLLYYAQGANLALYNAPLFDEPIQAWWHGPVCPAVYHQYKQYGNMPIPQPENFDPMSLPEQARDLLNEVYAVYGQFSAWRLREMTHNEPPWKTCYRDGVKDIEIPREVIKEYFVTIVNRQTSDSSAH